MFFFAGTVIGVTARAFLKLKSRRQLSFATDRFQSQIGEIDVILPDLNGRNRTLAVGGKAKRSGIRCIRFPDRGWWSVR